MSIPNEIILGKTHFFRIEDDGIEEFICNGCAEHLVWSDEDEACTPVTFLYGRNDGVRSFCFLTHSHPAFEHELILGKDVFLSIAEAEKELVSRKAAEEATTASGINDFKTKKRRKRLPHDIYI